MDLGLGNLLTVKTHLLASGVRTRTTWDDVLADIAKGVAAQFDAHCNRTFKRGASVTDVFPANADHVFLRRYPVESISAVHLRSDYVTGWVSQGTTVITNHDERNGLVYFGAPLGSWSAQIRVTYTGGYWFDTSENPAQPTSQPAGSTIVPADLESAWLLQCRHIWDKIDRLGAGTAANPDLKSTLTNLTLVPDVVNTLRGYRRYAMT